MKQNYFSMPISEAVWDSTGLVKSLTAHSGKLSLELHTSTHHKSEIANISSEKSKIALTHQDITSWKQQASSRLNGWSYQVPEMSSKHEWRRKSSIFLFSDQNTLFPILRLSWLIPFLPRCHFVSLIFCPDEFFITQSFFFFFFAQPVSSNSAKKTKFQMSKNLSLFWGAI